MTDAFKILEERKARILDAAQKEVANIDRDLEKLSELQRIADKYGLDVVRRDQSTTHTVSVQATVPVACRAVVAGEVAKSDTAKQKRAAIQVIRALNRPVPLDELYRHLVRLGVRIGGSNPKSVLSANLGQTPELYSISRDRGWWFKNIPAPDQQKASSIVDEGSGAPDSDEPSGASKTNGQVPLGS